MTHAPEPTSGAPRRSATTALGAYRGEPLATRLHVGLRAATCPLQRIERLVPEQGDLLEVGCGHGLVSILLAMGAPGRTVVGVDIDADKLAVARRAAERAGLSHRVRFDLVQPDWQPRAASTDVVVIVDLLYLLPPHRRRSLLHAAVAAVGRHGTVVVKEMAERPRWKRAVAVTQEWVSVGLLGITQGATVSLAGEAELIGPLLAAGAQVRSLDLGRGRPHPHLAVVARLDDQGYALGRPGAG